MDPTLHIETNIKRAFFETSSFLLEEPENIIRRVVLDPMFYNAILRAIAAGFTKDSDIAAAVGLEIKACIIYLENLISLGYVVRHTPVTEKSGKKTKYDIEDNMFLFWYRFIPDCLSLIQSGRTDSIWCEITQEIPVFMQQIFENICLQWVELRNNAGLFPVKFTKTGRWWGVDHTSKTDVVIPIVSCLDHSHALFGDCDWSDEPVGADLLISLDYRSRLLDYPSRYLFLFSRSGFSDECEELANDMGANLITFE
jgi:AAA+ ATPase superfamily predicted ATPase